MSLKVDDPDRPRWSTKDPWSLVENTPGAFPPSPRPDAVRNGEYPSVMDAVKARKDEYLRKKTIRVKIGTWNVAALPGTYKDLGGWFAEGLGVKGLTQDLTGLRVSESTADSSSVDDESDIEPIEEQEERHNKKTTTLPKHDSPAIPSGDDVDLYVIGLQEVIDVSSVTEAMRPFTDPNPAKKWKRALRKHLPPGYKKVVEQQLIGMLLLAFASPDLAPQISSVDSTSVGTGLMGYLGNKGAVSARILLGESTRVLFVNSHLAAGADSTALSRRIWDTQQIISRTRFAPVGEEWVGGVGQGEAIGDEDVAFWFGDLNYRLDDIPGEDVRRLLLLHARNEYDVYNSSKRRIDSELGFIPSTAGDNAVSNHYELPHNESSAAESSIEPQLDPENDPASLRTTLNSLFAHDQLRAQQRLKKVFHEGWREGDINFLPTYKYDVGSVAMFDSGEKKRSPSWCDRILYRTRYDYEQHLRKTKENAEAAKKDADMKKRGLDDEASQEDVLFDYDPDADGDDYDDQVEQHDNDHDTDLVRSREGFEDAIVLEEYVSHQRVLSSDHKPLSAVFSLTYDSVDTSLKAKVHLEVTRDFDKAENEARPSVTLVLDHHSYATSVTDRSSDDPELKLVDFGEIRYDVNYEHHLTIANTGPIEVTFAFVNRPLQNDDGTSAGPIPSWLKIDVHQDVDKSKVGPQDLGTALRYKLMPGDTTSIGLLIHITDPDVVKELNAGQMILEDILVLRISNGRDYFIPVKGSWLQTCFFRSVDELVRVPSGVRNLTVKNKAIEVQHQLSSTVVHSAPQELFALTEAIPKLTERAVADWDMLHDEEDAPWEGCQSWPFGVEKDASDPEMRPVRLAEVREALDTATTFDDYLGPAVDATEKLFLLAETLTTFLSSLTDGIVTPRVWQIIESQMQDFEKSKHDIGNDQLQGIVMEAISTTPVHSVALTFITFMLNQLISELSADAINQENSAIQASRARSSTTASYMSDVSLSSNKSSGSSKSKPSFFQSLTRRTTASSNATTPVSPTNNEQDTVAEGKAQLARHYAETFAPLIVRDGKVHAKVKEKKVRHDRKVRMLKAFLNQQP